MSSTDNAKEFYSNDIVYRFDKRKRMVIGVVIDSYEVSSDVNEIYTLQKGQIRVSWSNCSREQVWRQSKVHLINRSIIPGDVVRRLEKGKETQRGYAKVVKESVTVQVVGTDKVIEHVSGDRLKTVKPFNVDDAVCLGDKYGRIEGIEEVVTMESRCGSIVEVLTAVNHDLDDYWLYNRNNLLFEEHYPGQEVACTPNNLTQPNWIKKSKTMKKSMHMRQRFTVQKVQDSFIEVAWFNNSSGYAHMAELSPEEIKQLKVLEHPCDSNLEISSRRLLKLGAKDTLLKKKEWVRKLSFMYRSDIPKVRHIVNCSSKSKSRVPLNRSPSLVYNCPEFEVEEDWWTTEEGEDDSDDGGTSENSPSKRKMHYPPKLRELTPGNTLPVEVICVESKISVVWQDGSEEEDIPSTHLHYSLSLDDHEFFPGEWVVPEAAKEDSGSKYGVVQYVNYLERTASIKWFTYSESEKKPQELSVEEMSVYDLKKHSKFVFRPGSIVKSKPVQVNRMGKVIDSSPQGYVIVRWLGNVQENCWPQDIEVIPETAEYEFSDEESADEEDQVSWETESIESYAGDNTDETSLQNMAARLDFVRSRIAYLKDAFKQHVITESITYLKDLLLVYDNSSYLDKLLGTSFFSLKSKHFQALLLQAKEKAKSQGVELRGRLFCNDNLCPSITKIKVAEKENMTKMIKLENKINAQIQEPKDGEVSTEPPTPQTPEFDRALIQDDLCVELLSMIKVRMDLAYAEIISRIGGSQVLSVITKATHNNSAPLPGFPATPDDSYCSFKKHVLSNAIYSESYNLTLEPVENESYSIVEEAVTSHHYYTNKFQPNDHQKFVKAVQKECKLLRESLPPGVWVRSFSNRIDLLSVMIRGPAKTPYEDGLFLFDMQLSQDYPRSPPLVHYVSYSSERLNPNLYVEGKVCVSLLGTWMGRGTEVWGPDSTLLQLIVSIQGLILVSEPYYNEAGYDKQTETQQGNENSRTYNELVVLKLVQSMTEMLRSPPEVFKQEVIGHFALSGEKLCERLQRLCSDNDPLKPDFLLLPVSKGFKLSLSSSLDSFHQVLKKVVEENKINK